VNGPIVVTVDQLARRQPGGIGTYVRGLLGGLSELRAGGELTAPVVALAPKGTVLDDRTLRGAEAAFTRTGVRRTTRRWLNGSDGVPTTASVVHATSMAGPFFGGADGVRHSVLVHDLLWRDHPELTTTRGAAFHEDRLGAILSSSAMRVLVTSEDTRDALVSSGAEPNRTFVVRLGTTVPEPSLSDHALDDLGISSTVGVGGPFTLAVGTIEPRKNLERLIAAHDQAAARDPSMGPLVIVGAPGWGRVRIDHAMVLGGVDDVALATLWRASRLVAYVPVAEGWGFPAAEALAAGRPLVASTAVPSVRGNPHAILVDPLDVTAIADGLLAALRLPDGDEARAARRDSVAALTWANCARDHVAAWT
jgi:glycosyltransferase involved in cell wall biosynthesis